MAAQDDKEILIPEVLPPESGGTRSRPPWRDTAPPQGRVNERSRFDRVADFFGPILSGLILDASHIHPMRLPGFFLGLFLGYWFARSCNLRARHRFFIALASAFIGIYGLHRFMPIATIAGAWFATRNLQRRDGPPA